MKLRVAIRQIKARNDTEENRIILNVSYFAKWDFLIRIKIFFYFPTISNRI